MRIHSLKLLTNTLELLQQFYSECIGLPLLERSNESFTVLAGQSNLTFQQTEKADETPFYHFAFDIPSNKINEAIIWLTSKNISLNLLPNNSSTVFSESWNSTSLYFYDPAGNIVEFIARHSLQNEVLSSFTSNNILNISEIGLVVLDVTSTKDMMNSHLKLDAYKDSNASFAAVGDEQGLFILSSYKRIWLGSEKQAQIFKTEVTIEGDIKGTTYLDSYPYSIISI